MRKTQLVQDPESRKKDSQKFRNSKKNKEIECSEKIDLLTLDDYSTPRHNRESGKCQSPMNDITSSFTQCSANNYCTSISTTSMEEELRHVRCVLNSINTEITEFKQGKERQQYIVLQWRCVALVMDRLFFIVYIIVIGLSLALLFPRPYS